VTLDWPSGFDRTPERDRSPNRSYEVSLHDAITDLAEELGRLDVEDWRLSTDMDHQSRNPNYPYANQPEPDDPGVVVRWRMDGEQYAVACDAYSRVRDNLRTIGLYIHEKRKMEQRPVETGESEFANARLPPADEEDVVVAGAASEPAHEILEIDPNADPEVVKAAFRAKAKTAHPDQDGSRDEFQRLQTAKRVMLDKNGGEV
jgi:hypothetical protein